jgi:hypothetical protein
MMTKHDVISKKKDAMSSPDAECEGKQRINQGCYQQTKNNLQYTVRVCNWILQHTVTFIKHAENT